MVKSTCTPGHHVTLEDDKNTIAVQRQNTLTQDNLINSRGMSSYLCSFSPWLCNTLSAGFASSSALLIRMLHTRVLSCTCEADVMTMLLQDCHIPRIIPWASSKTTPFYHVQLTVITMWLCAHSRQQGAIVQPSWSFCLSADA